MGLLGKNILLNLYLLYLDARQNVSDKLEKKQSKNLEKEKFLRTFK